MKRFFKNAQNFLNNLGLYGLLFGLIIFMFSAVNCFKVLNFWIYDLTDYNEWSVNTGNKGETDYISNFWGKIQFINYNGLMRNLLGQNEMNGVIKLNNGYLWTTMSYASDEKLQGKADALLTLKEYLDTRGIPLLFAITPYTSSKYDPQLPIGTEDYGNENIDRFMALLKDRGIQTMDLRELLHENSVNHYDMMYKTDHHWTTKGGFYAYQKIGDYLEKELNCEIDEKVKNLENYNVTTYKKWHLGSRGQRTGIYFAGIDDFDLITPKFETSLICGEDSGAFEDIVINMEPLRNREYTSRYTYDNVMGHSLSDYYNPNAKNNKKLMVMADSMGKAVNPYLILSFQTVETLSNYSSEQLTSQRIDQSRPDAVLLLYYPDFLRSDNGFEFVIKGNTEVQ